MKTAIGSLADVLAPKMVNKRKRKATSSDAKDPSEGVPKKKKFRKKRAAQPNSEGMDASGGRDRRSRSNSATTAKGS